MSFLNKVMSIVWKRVCCWDLETENNEHLGRFASQFYDGNYVIAEGHSYNGGTVKWQYAHSREESDKMDWLPDLTNVDVLVGHNLSFDLLWVWKHPRLLEFLKRGGEIYCTQYGEYLLNAMDVDSHMNSMGDVARRYPEWGGGGKLDEVKEMWDRGILTSQIPKDLLLEYLSGTKDYYGREGEPGDIRNTWAMFAGQLERMDKMHPNFFTMVRKRMDGRLGTTEMEYNGVFANKEIGVEIRKEVAANVDRLKAVLDSYIPADMPPELEFNWGSPNMKSALIFGGSIAYLKWMPHLDEDGNLQFPMKTEQHPLFNGTPIHPKHCKDLGENGYVLQCPKELGHIQGADGSWYMLQDRVKSGKNAGTLKFLNVKVPNTAKPKGCKQTFAYTFKGQTEPESRWQTQTLDAMGKPLYSTGKKIIEKLMGRTTENAFLKAFMDYNKAIKDLETYYWKEDENGVPVSGMMTMIGDDGIIHHYINHTNTVTARNSSSKPNLQTVGRKGTSQFKKALTSRWKDGYMGEVDFSQLEVVNQGVLTGDVQLRRDLNNKVDFHIKRLTVLMNEAYEVLWKKHHVDEDPVIGEARNGAKKFSFLSQYGGGIDTIVYDTGLAKDVVQALASADEKMYPGIKAWYDDLEYLINSSAVGCGKYEYINGQRIELRRGYFDMPEGTRLSWTEYEAPEFVKARGKLVGFKPTERKNYPCQSLGGHIMQMAVGNIFRWGLQHDFFNGQLKMVNTVHDCIWLDGATKEITEAGCRAAKAIMEATPQIFNKLYGMSIDVPYPAEAEIGKDMFDMHVLH